MLIFHKMNEMSDPASMFLECHADTKFEQFAPDNGAKIQFKTSPITKWNLASYLLL